MTRIAASLVLLVLAAFAGPAAASAASDGAIPDIAAAVATQDEGGSPSTGDGWGEVVIWSIVGLAIFVVVGGVLYFMKRQMGGFPENPSWVAPITIMPSKDFPDEGDFGDQPPSHTAHAEH